MVVVAVAADRNDARGRVLAVLYEKPRTIVTCDYVWQRTELWIDFPWSEEPPVS